MAEVLGTLASGIAVAQLAGQIIASSQKIHGFWKSMKDAPKRIGDMLEEIEILGEVLLHLSDGFGHGSGNVEGQQLPGAVNEYKAVQGSLLYCRKVMEDLDSILVALNLGMRGKISAGEKNKARKWASFKSVIKAQELQDLTDKLERSKAILELAVSSSNMSVQRCQTSRQQQQIRMLEEQSLFLKSILSTQHTIKATLESQSRKKPQLRHMNRARAQALDASTSASVVDRTKGSDATVATTWRGIGWFHVLNTVSRPRSVNPARESASMEDNHVQDEIVYSEWRILPAAWLHLKGLVFTQTSRCGRWRYTLEPLHIVPDNALIFWACQQGDLDEVIRLVKDKNASVFDISEQGLTLLHQIHVRSSASGIYHKESKVERQIPSLVGLLCMQRRIRSVRQIGSMMSRSCQLLASIDHLIFKTRSDSLLKKEIRIQWPVLLEGIEVAHRCTCNGPVNTFQYLLRQDCFAIDFSEVDDEGDNIEIKQLASASRPLEPARLAMMHGQTIFKTVNSTYEELYSGTALHVALEWPARDVDIWSKTIHQILSKLLEAGADVYALDRNRYTPLRSLLASYLSLRYNPRCSTTEWKMTILLVSWLKLLKDVGYDLQQYAEAETLLCGGVQYRSRQWTSWKMYIEKNTGTEHLVWHIQEEPIGSPAQTAETTGDQEPELQLPGSWKHDSESSDSDDDEEDSDGEWKYWMPETGWSFTIGPLKDGVQVFSRLS